MTEPSRLTFSIAWSHTPGKLVEYEHPTTYVVRVRSAGIDVDWMTTMPGFSCTNKSGQGPETKCDNNVTPT